jgi:hypothetical protein
MQASPLTVFSAPAREHVHSPAARFPATLLDMPTVPGRGGDGPHEQVAPLTAFSVEDLSQLQSPAAFWPHEQVAS